MQPRRSSLLLAWPLTPALPRVQHAAVRRAEAGDSDNQESGQALPNRISPGPLRITRLSCDMYQVPDTPYLVYTYLLHYVHTYYREAGTMPRLQVCIYILKQ